MNVNTTDATTGATALLLPAQNTHTLPVSYGVLGCRNENFACETQSADSPDPHGPRPRRAATPERGGRAHLSAAAGDPGGRGRIPPASRCPHDPFHSPTRRHTPSLHIRYYNNRLSIKSANAKLFSVLSPIGSVIKSRSPDCASRSGRSERRSRRDRGHRPRPSARHGPRLRAAVREDAPVGRGC